MFSRSWRRAPMVGVSAALLLLSGLASAQGPVITEDGIAVPLTNAVKQKPKAGLLKLTQGPWVANRKAKIGPDFKQFAAGSSTVPTVHSLSIPAFSVTAPLTNFSFDGLGQQADNLRPGNVSVAVGPKYVLQTTEEGLFIFKRDGTPVAGNSWTGFFGTGWTYSQPHCIYDHYNDKFVMVLSQYNTTVDHDPLTSTGNISLIEAPGDNPVSGWTNWFYVGAATTGFGDPAGGAIIHDSPHIGYNASTLFIHINGRSFVDGTRISYGTMISSRILCIQSADAGSVLGYYNASPQFHAVNQGFTGSNNRANMPASMYSQKFDPADATRELAYVLHATNGNSAGTGIGGDAGGNGIRVRRLYSKWSNWVSGGTLANWFGIKDSSTLSTTAAGTGPLYFPPGLAYTPAPMAVLPGGTPMKTMDCRIQNISYLNNNLDTTQNIGLNLGSGTMGAILYWRLDCSGTGLPVPTRVGGIGVNGYDAYFAVPITATDGAINYVAGASSVFGLEPSVVSAGWQAGAGAPDGTINIIDGGAVANDFNQPLTDIWGATTNPWGSYFGASSDPVDRRQMFGTGTFTPNANTWSSGIYGLSYVPDSDLVVPDAAGMVGVPGNLTATLTHDGTGIGGKTITIKVNGTTVGTATTDGAGTATVSFTPASGTVGPHSITASFAGDPSYLASNGSGTLTVSKAMTTVAVAPVNGVVGQTVMLSANLSRGGTGLSGKTLTFTLDSTTIGSATTDVDGNAAVSYTIPEGAVGTHTIEATFGEDADNLGSSGTNALQVDKAPTTTTVDNLVSYPGGTVNLKAKLTRNIDGAGVAGRTIAFIVFGTAAGTATTDASGVATKSFNVPTSYAVGTTKMITATFSGDADYNASNGTGNLDIDKKTTLTSANASGNVGATVVLKATLKAGTAVAGATITFLVDGSSVGTATTDAAGLAQLNHVITEAAGAHVLVATFAGDGTNAPATSINYTLTAKALVTVMTVTSVSTTPGATVNLTGTLKSGTTALNGKTVQFLIGGISAGTATTNASGVATLSHVVTESGTSTLTAKFAGDATYAASSKDGTYTVKKLDTKTTVTAITGKVGATTTLKATVKAGSAAVVSGSVTFKVDGSTVGTGTTDTAGLATLPYVIPEGVGASHTITVEYAGDGTYNGSTGTAALTIQAAATKLTGEVVTAPAGTMTTVGAKLTRTTDGAGLAGKTITFTLPGGGTTTAVTDATGRASIMVNAPAKGKTDKYPVSFAAETNYTGSTGSASVKGT